MELLGFELRQLLFPELLLQRAEPPPPHRDQVSGSLRGWGAAWVGERWLWAFPGWPEWCRAPPGAGGTPGPGNLTALCKQWYRGSRGRGTAGLGLARGAHLPQGSLSDPNSLTFYPKEHAPKSGCQSMVFSQESVSRGGLGTVVDPMGVGLQGLLHLIRLLSFLPTWASSSVSWRGHAQHHTPVP